MDMFAHMQNSKKSFLDFCAQCGQGHPDVAPGTEPPVKISKTEVHVHLGPIQDSGATGVDLVLVAT